MNEAKLSKNEMKHEMKRKIWNNGQNIVPYGSVQMSVSRSSCWWESVLIGISLEVPRTKGLTFFPVAQKFFIFCLALGHFKQISLAKVFGLYHLFWLAALTTNGIKPSVFWWDAFKVGISDTSEVLRHQHLTNLNAELLVWQGGLVSELSNKMIVQNWPQTLFCRKIADNVVFRHIDLWNNIFINIKNWGKEIWGKLSFILKIKVVKEINALQQVKTVYTTILE